MAPASSSSLAAASGAGRTAAARAVDALPMQALLRSLVGPASKAYLLGYLVEVIPSILKHILRFVTTQARLLARQAKRFKEEKEVELEQRLEEEQKQLQLQQQDAGSGSEYDTATSSTPGPGGKKQRVKVVAKASRQATISAMRSTLRALPALLQAILASLWSSAISPKGMAICSSITIILWRLLEAALLNRFERSLAKRAGGGSASDALISTSRRVASCFIASALASAYALIILQSDTSASGSGTASSSSGGERRNSLSSPSTLAGSLSPLRSMRSMRKSSSQSSALLLKRIKSLTSPLAPGGHFLSRLTNLSIPPTPHAPAELDGGLTPAGGSNLPGAGPESIPRSVSPVAGVSPSASSARLDVPERKRSSGGSISISGAMPSPVQPPASPTLPAITINEHGSSAGAAAAAAGGGGGGKAAAKPYKAKPSPTIDFTLFALVRGLDTFVRVLPILLASRGLVAAGAGAPSGVAAAAGAAVAGAGAVGVAGEAASQGLRSSIRAARAANTTAGKGKGRATEGAAATLLRNILRKIGTLLVDQAEGFTFVVCCAQIMYSWFYYPERLPPTYVKWITNLATMDQRLLLALRSRRMGEPLHWKYGDNSVSPAAVDLCASLSESLGHSYGWGDCSRLPNSAAEARQMLAQARQRNREEAEARGEDFEAMTQAEQDAGYVLAGAAGLRGRGEMGGLPCEVVHCGVGGASCFANAGLRWYRGWKASMAIYVPVHLLPRLLFGPQQFVKKPVESLTKVVTGAARSAAFLATFISSIWFMVCVGRSLLLPRLFPDVSHNYWDAGLGPIMGSWACGFSVFIEERRKRAEMALYVAPRALFAVAESLRPGWLSNGKNKSALIAERIMFGLSAGLVITTAKFRPDLLRGVPSIMAWVIKETGAEKVNINAPRRVN